MEEVKIESGIDLSSLKAPIDSGGQESNAEEEPDEEITPMPVQDDPLAKRALIMECQQYRYHPQVGNKYLAAFDCNSNRLEQLTCAELESLKREMQFVLGARNGSAFWNASFMAGVGALEYGATMFTPLKIQGLSFHLSRAEEVKDIIAEIELKHAKYTYIEPEYRLLAVVGQTMLGLHSANSATETTQEILTAQMPADMNCKYEGL